MDIIMNTFGKTMHLRGLTDSAVGYIPPVHRFKPRPGYVRNVFRHLVRLISFELICLATALVTSGT